MAVVFMGTPAYVVPVLDALVEAGWAVSGVYTQPERPAGRGRVIEAPPVKEYALRRGLPVFQPTSWRSQEALQQLASQQPQAIVVAGYGRLLPAEVLRLAPGGCVNVHPSLLPQYRGPSPVVTALLEGDMTTGVTLILLDEGMDTGPILVQRSVPVEDHDTGGSLTRRLFEVGARLVVETLPAWLEGKVQPLPQGHSLATITRRMTKEDGQVDWDQPAVRLWRQVRAFDPWPGTYTFWRGRPLKVLEVSLPGVSTEGEPGRVLLLDGGAEARVVVVTGGGSALELLWVQIEGRRPLGVEEFLRGHPDLVGSKLPS